MPFGETAIVAQSPESSFGSSNALNSTDILIIGAGVAGLSFALSLPFTARVTLVTKHALGESNTRYAQGGLAAAVSDTDDAALHLHDTLVAGAGLVDETAARILVEGGKEAVDWLIERGTNFDQDHGKPALGREGAHSRARVLHAGGDATGAEIERALVAQIAEQHDLTVMAHSTTSDLLVDEHRCVGARLISGDRNEVFDIHAGLVVLAAGGAGQLWAETSNPLGATGDGIAIALRAGVVAADLEFTQFHPTVLNVPGQEPFLVSEAVRGDGAWLRNDEGERFMLAMDDRAELASRDVVARGIQEQMKRGSRVWLDLRHLDAGTIRQRFPTINRHLAEIGIDFAHDLIPVAPAAHYFMGGIAASPEGRTSLDNLLAIGEVSCTGVHGANRLASNSLLEGLVFGRRAAASLAGHSPVVSTRGTNRDLSHMPQATTATLSPTDARNEIRRIMRDHVSVVRSASTLALALAELDQVARTSNLCGMTAFESECRNMWLLAREISMSALRREESRGGHYRSDFPQSAPELNGRHQMVQLSASGDQRWFGDLASAWSATWI